MDSLRDESKPQLYDMIFNSAILYVFYNKSKNHIHDYVLINIRKMFSFTFFTQKNLLFCCNLVMNFIETSSYL